MREEWVAALAGGAMIGIASAVLLYCNGRLAGISNICSGIFPPARKDRKWRLAFLAGLLIGGGMLLLLHPAAFQAAAAGSPLKLAAAGFLVGLGARLANGCTSGHGICGLARLSPRSLIATAVFMASGMMSVFLLRHWNV